MEGTSPYSLSPSPNGHPDKLSISPLPRSERLSFSGMSKTHLVERPEQVRFYLESPLLKALDEISSENIHDFSASKFWAQLLDSSIPVVQTLQDSFDLDRAVSHILPNLCMSF